jgi:hypothetical protein
VTAGENLVIKYTGLNLFEIQELEIDVYLFYMREAFIHTMNETKEGREYLANCWRLSQTEPDRKAIREHFTKIGG